MVYDPQFYECAAFCTAEHTIREDIYTYMRSPAGSIRNHISHIDAYGSPSGSSHRIVVTTPTSPIGSVPAPEITALILELRGAVAQSLLELRGADVGLKDRSLIISHLTRSITGLVALDAMTHVDLHKLTDSELVDLGHKLMKDVTLHHS